MDNNNALTAILKRLAALEKSREEDKAKISSLEQDILISRAENATLKETLKNQNDAIHDLENKLDIKKNNILSTNREHNNPFFQLDIVQKNVKPYIKNDIEKEIDNKISQFKEMQKLLNEIRKEDYPKNALPQFQSNNKTFNKLTALFPGGQVLLDKSNEYRHEFYKKYCDSAIDLLENIKKQYEIDVSSKILNEKEYRKTLDNIDTNMKNMSTNKEVYDIAISFLKILDDNQESINNKIEDSRKKNRTRYIESL